MNGTVSVTSTVIDMLPDEIQHVKSPAPLSILDQARHYTAAGLSVIPTWGPTAPAGKSPKAAALKSWTPYKTKAPTDADHTNWFAKTPDRWAALVCGTVSGYRAALDFDVPAAWDEYRELLAQVAPELAGRLCVVKSQKGWHVHLSCPTWPAYRQFPRKTVLAQCEDGKSPRVELQAEGSYILLPGGKAPYAHHSGPPVEQGTQVTPDELEVLIDAARSLDRAAKTPTKVPSTPGRAGSRPGDVFNSRATADPEIVRAILREAQWELVSTRSDGTEDWRRPGKNDGTSATFGKCKTGDGVPCLWVFSTSSYPLPSGELLYPFAVYTYLKHAKEGKPDWTAATVALAKQGYGKLTEGRGDQAAADLAGFPAGRRGTDRIMGSPSWLWEGRLQAAALNVIVGDIGAGKSTYAAYLAARVSRGGSFPFTKDAIPAGTVLYFGPESVGDNDAPDEEFLPRFVAAAGDRANVITYGEPFTLPADADKLEKVIRAEGARLVILDPVNDFIDPSLRSADDKAIRAALRPLAGVASRTGCTIVALMHTNKKRGEQAADRAAGSKAYLSISRAASYLAKDPLDPTRSVVAPIRVSRAEEGPSVSFERRSTTVTEESTGEEIKTVVCADWRTDDRTADGVAGADQAAGQKTRGAPRRLDHERIRELLAEGFSPEEVGREVGCHASTVRGLRREWKAEGNSYTGNYSHRGLGSPADPVASDENNSRIAVSPRGRFSLLLQTAAQFHLPLSTLTLWTHHPDAADLDPDLHKPILSLADSLYGPLWFLFHVLPDGVDLTPEDVSILDTWTAEAAALDPKAQVSFWDDLRSIDPDYVLAS